jgi:hypothetical protein
MTDKSNRLKLFFLPMRKLAGFLNGDLVFNGSALPKDAVVYRVYPEFALDALGLIVWSAQYDEVPEHGEIPSDPRDMFAPTERVSGVVQADPVTRIGECLERIEAMLEARLDRLCRGLT